MQRIRNVRFSEERGSFFSMKSGREGVNSKSYEKTVEQTS